MWLRHRVRRIQTKLRNLNTYFRTLSVANEIQRTTDLTHSKNLVLLLYGFGATRRSVSILESRLKKDGFDVISIKLGGFLDLFNTAPIDQLAKKIAQKIDSLCLRYPLPRFTIIGYSKGGLIGRYYVTHLGGAKRVHTLITLATPHLGSPLALVSGFLLIGLLSTGLRQMRPSSKFMRELAQKEIPPEVYAVSIYSTLDKTCPPKYSLLPKGTDSSAVHNIELSEFTHSDFIIKKKAYDEIYTHLQAGLKHALRNAT